MFSSHLKFCFLSVLAAACVSTGAEAADEPGFESLTFYGITLSGIVDVGFAHQTYGAGLNPDYYTGLEWVVSKNSSHPVTTVAPNGLSQTRLVLSGAEPIISGWSGVFKLESDFSPITGSLGNSSKTLVENAGVPLDQQNTNADGNRQGQLFAGSAYAGISSATWGTLTYGRQTSVFADAIMHYDPQAGSYAFSLLGYSGFLAGAGTTQDVRMDNTVKYNAGYKWFRFAALYQFRGADGYGGGAEQANLGFDQGPFSIDAAYSHVGDAVTVSGLSAAQVANPLIPSNSLAATVSDNTAYGVFARYRLGPALIMGGYEHIIFANPANPLTQGLTDEGGYLVSASVTNNDAYPLKREEDLYWFGVRYLVTPHLTVSAGYYRANQNSYHGDGCSSAAFASCSGHEDAASLVFDYRLTAHWDVYLGSMYTGVAGGMSSGFLHDSSIGSMAGARFMF